MRGYTSRRIASAVQGPRPVETPDTDAATVYVQRWARQDGTSFRNFNVLALDDQMAEEMGGLRLREHYDQNPMAWRLEMSRPCERMTSMLISVLYAETPDETQLRENTFSERLKGLSA